MAGRIAASVALLAVALVSSCDGSESSSREPPCVVPEDELASIWGVPEISSHPQKNGHDCLYAADGEILVMVSVRSRQQFEAERARFEDQGFLLPPLEPTGGFEEEATVDPRYNSLNVTAGDTIVSVEVVAAEPPDAAEQLALEKRIARAALDQLGSGPSSA
jgi:hypothetical protein